MEETFVANRWIVYLASVLVTLNYGIMFSMGALFVPLLDKFGASRSATALVQSLMLGMAGLGIISGILVSKYGLRKVAFLGSVLTSSGFTAAYFATSIYHLYIFVSILGGVGIIHLFICATVATGQVFEGKTKLTAISIQMSTIGIGAIGYPYLMQYLIPLYGVNGTYLILGGIWLNNFCVAIIYGKREEESKHRKRYSERREEQSNTQADRKYRCACCQSWISLLKEEMKSILSVSYVLLLLATALGVSSLDGYLTVFIDIYIWKTFSENQATGSILPYQAATFVVQILSGLLKQIQGFDSLVTPAICTLTGCVGAGVIFLSRSYIVAYVGTGLLGLALGGNATAYGMVVADLVPSKQLGTAIGLVQTVIAIFVIPVGPIYGAIRDETDSYAPVLLVIGLVQLAAFGLYLAALIARRLSLKRSDVISMHDISITTGEASKTDAEIHM